MKHDGDKLVERLAEFDPELLDFYTKRARGFMQKYSHVTRRSIMDFFQFGDTTMGNINKNVNKRGK